MQPNRIIQQMYVSATLLIFTTIMTSLFVCGTTNPVICLFFYLWKFWLSWVAAFFFFFLKLLHVCCLILKWQDRAVPEAATISVKAMKIYPLLALMSNKSTAFWKRCDWVSMHIHCNNMSVTGLFFPTLNKIWQKKETRSTTRLSFLHCILLLFIHSPPLPIPYPTLSKKKKKQHCLTILLCILSLSLFSFFINQEDMICYVTACTMQHTENRKKENNTN